jgi:DNA-binding transcriptional regulator GbsR (MarR family)
MQKMTQKDFFNEIIALAKTANREDIVEFAQERIEALNKKTASRKPSKTQKENVDLKNKIAEVLTSEGQTVTEIIASLGVDGLSNQKVSALLRQMEADGIVAKTTDKRKSLFALA